MSLFGGIGLRGIAVNWAVGLALGSVVLRADAQGVGPRVDNLPRVIAPRFVKDPAEEERQAFRSRVRRELYNNSRFAELEAIVADVRSAKAKFSDGTWKIESFYDSLECRSSEPESMWQLHDRIHRSWIAQFPESVAARVAHADFFCSYAWHARGSGFADSVTPEGWRLFKERLASAHAIVEGARKLKQKDPYLDLVALTVALGEGPAQEEYDALVEAAHAAEPTFWRYDTKRAYSLLPRWHGAPGDWESFAAKASARPDGLGAEVYARIVLWLTGYYDDIFVESEASWSKTREGLELMLKRYPDSLTVGNQAAMLAVKAKDKAMARRVFAQLDGACVTQVWGGPERFIGALKWANKPD